MTFDDLKDLKQGAILIRKDGSEVEFVCLYRKRLVYQKHSPNTGFMTSSESEAGVKNWTIKKERKLYWRRVIGSCKYYIDVSTAYYSDDSPSYGNLEKVGNPINQDGNEVTDYEEN